MDSSLLARLGWKKQHEGSEAPSNDTPAAAPCGPQVTLPPYSPAVNTPGYSRLPTANEETLQFTPRYPDAQASLEGGNFVHKWRHATLTLRGQDEKQLMPCYGRNSLIHGELEVIVPADVVEVDVTVEGRMSILVPDMGMSDSILVTKTQLLWTQREDEQCPSLLPIEMRMPCTLSDDTRRLPPTYNAMFYMAPTLWVGITFELIIQIKRKPQRFGLWNRGQRYSVEIEHCPRTRPARPISSCFNTILSTVKYVPDEWHQFSSTLHAKNAGVESVNCTVRRCPCDKDLALNVDVWTQFLTPAVQTYGLEDAIPFHIQLSGPLGSLSLLVPDKLLMAVSLVRRTVVTVNGRTQWRNRSIGEGKVWAIPPPATASVDALHGVYMDWEGEVRCTSEVRSGSFNIGTVAVQDYVLFALVPSGGNKAPFMPLQRLHPIRLVTDSWTEESWTHPLDI